MRRNLLKAIQRSLFISKTPIKSYQMKPFQFEEVYSKKPMQRNLCNETYAKKPMQRSIFKKAYSKKLIQRSLFKEAFEVTSKVSLKSDQQDHDRSLVGAEQTRSQAKSC